MKTITAIWYVSRGHDRTKPIPYQVTPPPSDVLGIDKGAARSRAAKTAPSTWAPSEPGRDGADRTTTRYGDGMDEPALTASVVIPTHRGAQRLPRLLAALARQDFPGRWNVVVSVDGVVDDTLATIDRHRADLALVTVVEPTGRGVAAALNRGFEAADGDIIIRCDDDLTPRPDMVRRHVELHAREELLLVNATRTKQLTNFRVSGKEDAIKITPPIALTLEYGVEFIEDDELVEITPKSIRLRKRYLKEHERKRASREAG